MIVARWSSDMSKSQLCLRTIYVVRALPGAHGVKTLPVDLYDLEDQQHFICD